MNPVTFLTFAQIFSMVYFHSEKKLLFNNVKSFLILNRPVIFFFARVQSMNDIHSVDCPQEKYTPE